MALRISHTSIDSHDAYAQSLWWGEVLGYAEDPNDPNAADHDECMIISPDGSSRVLFITVPEEKTVKNRIHFDLRPTDVSREEEVDRVVGLGATRIADFVRPDGTGWIVLADPEGNEFCILTGQPQLDALGL